MRPLICEMCSSNDMVKQNGLFVCQSCGTKYSVEEARKIMFDGPIDISGSTIKIDNSEEISNLYELARRAKASDSRESALKFYDQILVKDPSNWEPNFYTVYYRSVNFRVGNIRKAALDLVKCQSSVFDLINDNYSDSRECRKAVYEVVSKLIPISKSLFNSAKNYYASSKNMNEYVSMAVPCINILYVCGDCIARTFRGAYTEEFSVACWKYAVEEHSILLECLADKRKNKELVRQYIELIQHFEPSYKAPRVFRNGLGLF